MKLLQIVYRECLENAKVYSTHQINNAISTDHKKCKEFDEQDNGEEQQQRVDIASTTDWTQPLLGTWNKFVF